jgi:PLP dependent protein
VAHAQNQCMQSFKLVCNKQNTSTASLTELKQVRLIAVSKLHPASSILCLHDPAAAPATTSASATTPQASLPPPQLHFGENYVQELQQKASLLPRSIRWHFIGGLQSNKCKALAEIENLWCVSSVDSTKKAEQLEKGRKALVERLGLSGRSDGEVEGHDRWDEMRLRVHVQVNTSGEEAKSGAEPGKETVELCRFVVDKCPHLQLVGLMTIGAIARSVEMAEGKENEDFVALKDARDTVAQELGWKKEDLELSMGMSADFEGAIAMGSNEVRIGSTIFGDRPPKSEAKVLDDPPES